MPRFFCIGLLLMLGCRPLQKEWDTDTGESHIQDFTSVAGDTNTDGKYQTEEETSGVDSEISSTLKNDSDKGEYSDSATDTHTGGDTQSDTDGDTDADADGDSDSDSDTDSDADTDVDTDADSDADTSDTMFVDTNSQTHLDGGDRDIPPSADGSDTIGTACSSNGQCGMCEICYDLVCVFAAAGADPKEECPEEEADACGTTGSCDGKGGCELYGTEIPCNDDDWCTYDDRCDGKGGCRGTAISCEHASGTCGEQRECNGTEACTVFLPGTGVLCDDNDFMTVDDRCDGAGRCIGDDYCEHHNCWKIPPTEQTRCYSESAPMGDCGSFPCPFREVTSRLCGQDAQYPDNERVFTCYDSNGETQSPCEKPPTTNEVVVDELEGLTWQRTWHVAATHEDAMQYCLNLNYARNEAWRLPTVRELLSLVTYTDVSTDYEPINSLVPSINTAAFPGTPYMIALENVANTGFFAEESDVTDPTKAWVVEFAYGLNRSLSASIPQNVRCVSGPRQDSDAPDRYVVLGSSDATTIADRNTGLVWSGEHKESALWSSALLFCENLLTGGYSDWRLPSVSELSSLLDFGRNAPMTTFPGLAKTWFWSSTTYAGDYNDPRAWYVHFTFGEIDFNTSGDVSDDDQHMDVRCVRGGLPE